MSLAENYNKLWGFFDGREFATNVNRADYAMAQVRAHARCSTPVGQA